MDFPWTADEPTYMADSSTSFHGSDDYSRRPHVSKLDVQAILSPDNTSGAAPITMFWSKPTTEYNGHGFVLLLRYHSRNIQIAIKGERSAPDERLCVDDSPVISGWTTITEKSKIEVGCTSWKLTIRHIEGLTITKLLGKGGSAFVYEVLLGEPPVRYALKVPRDPEYDRVICGEYDVLKYLEKCGVPNVVRAHEIREPKIDLEGPLLFLDFGGRSLLEIVQQNRKKKFDVKRIAGELCRTLKIMHSLGIDHSDLKPANILLSPSGSARIIDIGIEKCSTPSWLPPEASDDLCYETWPRPELLSNLPSFIRYRSFTPATDSWQLASILCMLHLVNKDPDIIYEDQSSSGLLGFKMDNGKYRSHFATLRKAADELEVDFIKRLHAINVRQRLTMEKALQHAYLSGATSPPTRRNKAALSSGLRFSGHH